LAGLVVAAYQPRASARLQGSRQGRSADGRDRPMPWALLSRDLACSQRLRDCVADSAQLRLESFIDSLRPKCSAFRLHRRSRRIEGRPLERQRRTGRPGRPGVGCSAWRCIAARLICSGSCGRCDTTTATTSSTSRNVTEHDRESSSSPRGHGCAPRGSPKVRAAEFRPSSCHVPPVKSLRAQKRARRIRRQRGLAGARQTEEQRHIALGADIGRAMHRQFLNEFLPTPGK
jgi:hypothetical protein